jgi:hypothetical protein
MSFMLCKTYDQKYFDTRQQLAKIRLRMATAPTKRQRTAAFAAIVSGVFLFSGQPKPGEICLT